MMLLMWHNFLLHLWERLYNDFFRVCVMPKNLKFYDLKGRKSFSTGKYTAVTRKGRRFAVATAPSGAKAWRILGKKK